MRPHRVATVGCLLVLGACGGGVTGPPAQVIEDPGTCPTRVTVSLSPGEHQSYASDECLLLPSGQVGDYYRIAVTRPTLVADPANVVDVTLRIDPVPTTVSAPAPPPGQARAQVPQPRRASDARKLDLGGMEGELELRERTRRYHAELRRRERDLGLDASTVLPNLASGVSAARVDPPARRDMYLELTCSAAVTTRPVLLVDFDDNLAIYQDSAQAQSDPISTTATGLMRAYFQDYARDMITEYWGAIPDTDGNGRVIVVTTPSLDSTAAAAVFGGDFATPSVCPSSNQGEVIYFRNQLFQDLVASKPGYHALSTVAHEMKHVVSIYHGFLRGGGGSSGDFNDLWIEEGTAEIAQVMSSRIAWAAVGGPSVGAVIQGGDIVAAGQTPENWAIVSELADVVATLSAHPNSLLTDPDGASSRHSFYGSSWHWHRFLGDAFGGATAPLADSTFFRSLVDPGTPAGGASGEVQLTGRTFDQLFEDLVVAMSLHGTAHNLTHQFTTWDFITTTDIFTGPPELVPPGIYPWPVTANDALSRLWAPFDSATFDGPIGPAGIRFHDFQSTGLHSAQILVTGAGSLGRIVVTRLS